MRTEVYDVAVIGSGFAGSIMSMVLRRLGKSVLLLERGSHPRFAIGESSTPFANLLLERLAEDYDLPFLRAFSEWGSWQKSFPHVPAGLKRGFTFYHHSCGKPLDFGAAKTQLLVAASPHDRVADTHWYRPAFDQFLVNEARKLGVEYRDHCQIETLQRSENAWNVRGTRSLESKEPFQAHARFIIDASGGSGDLLFRNAAGRFDCMPETRGVYAHFRNVPRLSELFPGASDSAPYPPDDAAVHHVFDDGWIWVLRFNNGITSAGAALRSSSGNLSSAPPEKIWTGLLARFPTLDRAFATATPITPFYHSRSLSFRRAAAFGPNWVALPSAVGFVDPLLSTGFALTLLGISRLGELFQRTSPDLRGYQHSTLTELDATADLVSALYAKFHRFEEFSPLSLLYFAAMSFTETAWRLGKKELASGFLLSNDETFTSSRKALCAAARHGETITRDQVIQAIDRYDVAGLTQPKRNNWYPVNFEDLRANIHKLGATPAELEPLLSKLATQ